MVTPYILEEQRVTAPYFREVKRGLVLPERCRLGRWRGVIWVVAVFLGMYFGGDGWVWEG